ncbi:GD18761 [Drosophila simulans]|uniref:GD18761 n=1 Tax=Drosophila simulans TaxID=7240 RepID=B4QU30_DROSI|nr:GD18761 [Drosophila simulans]
MHVDVNLDEDVHVAVDVAVYVNVDVTVDENVDVAPKRGPVMLRLHCVNAFC